MADKGQFDFSFAPPPRRIWTVRDLVSAVRTSIEREYTDVWLEGEISNYRPAESGHLYFTIKDSAAQVRVVMFRTQARLLRFKPENGMQIVARGRVTVYEARGELQLLAEYLEPKGAGVLQVAFEQLKARLAEEGLFDAARKRPIPALPRRVGVITSPRGAAVRDIINVLRRRHESLHVLIYPAQMQGEAAPAEVSAGIRHFSRTRAVDVVIIARGGGSIEDLAAFNHEGLARTVAASKVPVISAIGHETDFTICDFVADLRAPTPSAAAEIVVRSKQELKEKLLNLHQRLVRAARYQVLIARQRLTELAQHGAFARMREVINRREQRLDELVYRLAEAARRILRGYRQRVEIAAARVRYHDMRRQLVGTRKVLAGQTNALAAATRAVLFGRRTRLEKLAARLQDLSPLNILERGYALVFDSAGVLVKDASQVRLGEELETQLARGRIVSVVKDKKS